MRERPILFAGPMVQALLAGRKTQTRRIMRPQPGPGSVILSGPYGVPGDRLWVRETWAMAQCDRHVVSCDCRTFPIYRSDCPPVSQKCPGWRPSIFMPRWASRLTLEVTEVRVERLQDISEEDAQAEGVEPYAGLGPDQRVPGPGFCGALLADQPHRLPFADLWDTINGKRAPWASNPFVWAITFKRAE